jgi:MoaA/NifB/PqqE/SkfB family radical SAM enzyme
MTSEGDSSPEASSMTTTVLKKYDPATRERGSGHGPGLPLSDPGVAAAFDPHGLTGDAADGGTRPSTAGASPMSDKTEVLAPASSAPPGRATAWVALHATTSAQRATIQGTKAHAAALKALKKAQSVYDALIAIPDPAAPADAPDTFCRRLLARLQRMLGPEDADAWQHFLAWAQRSVKPPRLLHVLAATAAALEEDWPRVFRHAKTAVAMNQRDLFAQRLFLRARAKIDQSAAPLTDDLSDFFCPHPFESFELRPNGDVHTCCPAWLPVPIGNFHRETPEEIWNSAAARAIRSSILDGTYRYCSRMHCTAIVNRRLPRRADLKEAYHREIVAQKLVRLERRPVRVLMSQDQSCNLSCPSCRTKRSLAGKDEQGRLNELFETVIFPLLRDARQVKITGSGDPFASGHYRYVLKRLSRREIPRLRVQLQTNGLLLDRRAWQELGLDGLVESVWVSIDAARSETYAIVRRGGSFGRLLQNFEFLGQLRGQDRIERLRLDFVVQARNFREMPDAVTIARAFGFDCIHFQMIRNWGTFTVAEFDGHFIGSPDHPDYREFLEVLRHPNLAWAGVDWSNVRQLYDRANAAQHPTRSP